MSGYKSKASIDSDSFRMTQQDHETLQKKMASKKAVDFYNL
jgi:hypothetical protein